LIEQSSEKWRDCVDANGGVTQSRYDNGGNRIQLTDASFNTTCWQHDAQGQVLSETDPNRLSIVNEYDLVGNIFAVTDRRGYRIQFVRDNLDNVLLEHWLQPSGTSIAFVSQIENIYRTNRATHLDRGLGKCGQIEPPTLTGVWGNDIVRPSICQRFLVWGGL